MSETLPPPTSDAATFATQPRQPAPQTAEVDVHAVAQACLDVIRPAANAKNLALSITMAPDTPRWMVIDPTRLRQILLHLLSNAVKLTSRGTVQIRLHPMAGEMALRIEVADTSPDSQEAAAQAAGGAQAADGNGSGIALAARLASVMGGQLRHAGNPGGGSLFWLELPLHSPAAFDPSAMPPDEPPSQPRPLQVLVVDDVAMGRDIAAAFLRAAGHQVTCLENGADAVAAVAGTDFDVVFMDVRMPGMDGLEATRRIRMLAGARSRVPIVALTAQAFTDQVAECRKAGMNDHLPKPFDPDTLHAVVMRAFTSHKARHAGVAPAPLPPEHPVSPSAADHRIFDPRVFERTAIFLEPDLVAYHLRAVAADAQTLLSLLRQPNALIGSKQQLAEATHTLSGTVGMFGFQQLTAVSRRFGRSVSYGAPEMHALATEFAAALETALKEINNRILIAVETARSATLAPGPGSDDASPQHPGGRLWMQVPTASSQTRSSPATRAPHQAFSKMPPNPAPAGPMPPNPAPAVPTTPTLPLSIAADPTLADPARSFGLHVLVVDDDAMIRDLAAAFLRASGNQVTCAGTGAQAVDAAAMTDFDVVLMDVRMPGMDGLEATRRIRSLHGIRGRVPIVALTARAFTEQVAECRGAGMDDHLRKPFYADTLQAAVARATTANRPPVPTPRNQ